MTDSTIPLYQRAFPDFPALDVALPDGFVDTSWKNDTMPSFSRELPNHQQLKLYIDYPNPADREEPQSKRFYLGVYEDGVEHVRDVASSDDYAEILQALAAFESAAQG